MKHLFLISPKIIEADAENVLQLECEMSAVHSYLAKLPNALILEEIEYMISKAHSTFVEHPPDILQRQARKIVGQRCVKHYYFLSLLVRVYRAKAIWGGGIFDLQTYGEVPLEKSEELPCPGVKFLKIITCLGEKFSLTIPCPRVSSNKVVRSL